MTKEEFLELCKQGKAILYNTEPPGVASSGSNLRCSQGEQLENLEEPENRDSEWVW